jgi:hypothetical protein
MTKFSKRIIPILLIFIVTTIICLLGMDWLTQNKIDAQVLLVGNIILFIVTVFSLWLLGKAMYAKTTTQFLGFAYASIMGKMMICAISVLIYTQVAKIVNKPAIFVLMGLYLVYTTVEIIKINALKAELKNAKATSSH